MKYLLLFFTIFPIYLISYNNTVEGLFLYQLSNFIIVAFSLYQIFIRETALSFNSNTVLFLFVYIFMGIAPLYQITEQVNIWGGEKLLAFDYLFANIILLIAIFIYSFFYNYFNSIFNIRYHKISRANPIRKNRKRKKYIPLSLAFLSLFITLFNYKDYLILLFLREVSGADLEFSSFGNTSLNLLYTFIIRPIPILLLVYNNIVDKKKSLYSLTLIVIVLMTNFPLSLPRFYVAGLYLPILISYFPLLLFRKYFLKVLLIFGLLYIFPFLNQGRTVTNINDIEFSLSFNYDMFLEGHFDTFQSLVRVLKYDTVTYGYQLIGVILFFIPRSFFINKPGGSGGYISELYSLNFDHISLNYWGEGWINFGFIGIVIFSLLIAYINAYFDFNYLKDQLGLRMKICFYIYLGMLFFILRGDLISCYAYTIGLFITTFLCYKFIFKNNY